MTQTIYGSLKDKSVLITGGASGIGESIARSFHAQGSKVAILDYNAEAGQALAKELGERVHFEHSDVRDIPAFQAAIRRASDAVGPITILINNAARDDRHTIDQVTPEYWRERFATNLDHQFFAAQAVLPDMEKAGGGSIINMGSTSYMVSDDSFAAYKTAKSASVGLTRALAREMGQHNITVNCIAPGPVDTDIMGGTLTDVRKADMSRDILVGRVGTVRDIAALMVFLMGEDAGYITAATYDINGGLQIS